MHDILFALWFFMPAGAANAAPIIAAKLPLLSAWNTPMDFGKSFRSKRLLGSHKTWRGLLSGILIAILVVYLQQSLAEQSHLNFLNQGKDDYLSASAWLLGFLFGAGALLGDAAESAVKRQLDIEPGSAWFPFDQVDYIIGGCLFAAVVVRLSLFDYVAVLVTWLVMHVVFSYIGYRFKLKPTPI